MRYIPGAGGRCALLDKRADVFDACADGGKNCTAAASPADARHLVPCRATVRCCLSATQQPQQ